MGIMHGRATHLVGHRNSLQGALDVVSRRLVGNHDNRHRPPGARPRWIMLSMETPALCEMAGDFGQHARHVQHLEAQIECERGATASALVFSGIRECAGTAECRADVARAQYQQIGNDGGGGRRLARAAAFEKERPCRARIRRQRH